MHMEVEQAKLCKWMDGWLFNKAIHDLIMVASCSSFSWMDGWMSGCVEGGVLG